MSVILSKGPDIASSSKAEITQPQLIPPVADRPPLAPLPQYIFNSCTVYMGTNNSQFILRHENIEQVNPTNV